MKSALTFLAFIAAILLRGFVLAKLWAWFIVPLGLPIISIPEALGLSTTVAFLTYELHKDDREAGELLGISIVASLGSLGFGFLYAHFL